MTAKDIAITVAVVVGTSIVLETLAVARIVDWRRVPEWLGLMINPPSKAGNDTQGAPQ